VILGLAAALPGVLTAGLVDHGVPAAAAAKVAHLPPVSALFAALLGYNPIRTLLAPTGVLRSLPVGTVAVLTGRQFFPHLIAAAFHHGLVTVFTAAAAMALTGALVSSLRGGQYYYEEQEGPPSPPGPDMTAAPVRKATRTGMAAGRPLPAQQMNSPPKGVLRRAPHRARTGKGRPPRSRSTQGGAQA